MFHQPLILEVKLAQLEQIVGKGLPAREQLFVTAKATVERVPSCINDPGIRKNQTGKAGMYEVVRQLVGETRRE